MTSYVPPIVQTLRKPLLSLSILIAIYLVFTLPALSSSNHLLYNLEPYPDGILYALGGKNWIAGNGVRLLYNQTSLDIWVPSLYAKVLGLGYAFWAATQSFYLTNVLLGVSALSALYYLVYKLTDSSLAALCAGIVYLSHPYLLWLPSVPMTENFSVLAFILSLYGILLSPSKHRWRVVSLVAMIGLFLTRYSVVSVVFALLSLLIIRSQSSIKWRGQTQLVASALVATLAVLVGAIATDTLGVLQGALINVFDGTQYYGTRFFVQNSTAYIRQLLGLNTQFLWLNHSFTSAVFSLSMLAFFAYQHTHGSESGRWQALVLSISVIAMYPILLFFFVVDARYTIFLLPIIALTLGLAFDAVRNQLGQPQALTLAAILLAIHTGFQIPFYKQLIADNLLHRSVAWQYESIMHFDDVLSRQNLESEPILITALPPFLVNEYQTVPYQLLPLSSHQEFIASNHFVWGEEIQYAALLDEYRSLLESGAPVYISNAYITHSAAVVQDFETIMSTFSSELVASGCHDACNVYKLLPIEE